MNEIWLNWWKEIVAASAIGLAIVAKTVWNSLVPILQAWSQSRAEKFKNENKLKEQEHIIKSLVEGVEDFSQNGGDLKSIIQAKSFKYGVADELHNFITSINEPTPD